MILVLFVNACTTNRSTDEEVKALIAEMCFPTNTECVCLITELGKHFTPDVISRIDRDLSQEEKDQLNSFIPYLDRTCGTNLFPQ